MSKLCAAFALAAFVQAASASSCATCVSESKVWCYKDSQCHLPDSPSDPCYNAQCVSTSYFSTCDCKKCSDSSCDVQFVNTAAAAGVTGKGHSFAVAMADVNGEYSSSFSFSVLLFFLFKALKTATANGNCNGNCCCCCCCCRFWCCCCCGRGCSFI